MQISLLFWILMLLWLVFGVVPTWPAEGGKYYGFAGGLLLFALIAILGWKTFGPALHQ